MNSFLKTALTLGIALGLFSSPQTHAAELEAVPENWKSIVPTQAEKDARLGWWRDARFGMFVHWGVSSHLAGSWQGKDLGGYAEHIQRAQKISMADYRKEAVEKFNPTEFNADEWMRLAKETGMGYFIITAKHHDGFAMYDSKVSDYNVVKATPFHRDPMRELRDAAKKYGIKFGFYYSHAFDWGEENGPGNDWEYDNPGGDKLLGGAEWWETRKDFLPKARKYVDEKAIPQILELLKTYQPDIMWFDTPHKLPLEENLRIYAALRKADPNVVVNSRLFNKFRPIFADYNNTSDKPDEFSPVNGDWEGIPTTNESYGYNKNDLSHKKPGELIRVLVKGNARGGNILLNIGPMGNGRVDPKDVAILQGIGAWWKTNGESIRGTTRSPLAVQAWGESTRKGNTLYLHVFDWPKNNSLVVGGLKSDPTSAVLLATPDKPLAFRRNGDDVVIDLPAQAPDADNSVLKLELASEPQTDLARLLQPSFGTNVLRCLDARVEGGVRYGQGRKKRDDWVNNWTSKEGAISWPVRTNEKTAFGVEILYDAPTDSKNNRFVEGDAGKELAVANRGAGGTYVVHIGGQKIERPVKTGRRVRESLGTVMLEPGTSEIRITAKDITGEELFRPVSLTLKTATK